MRYMFFDNVLTVTLSRLDTLRNRVLIKIFQQEFALSTLIWAIHLEDRFYVE